MPPSAVNGSGLAELALSDDGRIVAQNAIRRSLSGFGSGTGVLHRRGTSRRRRRISTNCDLAFATLAVGQCKAHLQLYKPTRDLLESDQLMQIGINRNRTLRKGALCATGGSQSVRRGGWSVESGRQSK